MILILDFVDHLIDNKMSKQYFILYHINKEVFELRFIQWSDNCTIVMLFLCAVLTHMV